MFPMSSLSGVVDVFEMHDMKRPFLFSGRITCEINVNKSNSNDTGHGVHSLDVPEIEQGHGDERQHQAKQRSVYHAGSGRLPVVVFLREFRYFQNFGVAGQFPWTRKYVCIGCASERRPRVRALNRDPFNERSTYYFRLPSRDKSFFGGRIEKKEYATTFAPSVRRRPIVPGLQTV